MKRNFNNKKYAALIFLLFFILTFPAYSEKTINPDNSGEYNRLLTNKIIMNETIYYKKALSYYENILKKNPRDIDTIYNKAYCLLKTGRIQKAVECYNFILSINPFHIRSLNSLSEILRNKNELTASLIYSEKAVLADPLNQNAFYQASLTSMKLNNYDKAQEYIDRALFLNSTDPDSWLIKCSLTERINPSEAMVLYKKAVSIIPENKYLINNMGVCFIGTGDKKNALSCFQKAYKLDNQYFESVFNLALIRELNDDHIPANEYILKALKLKPLDREALKLSALINFNLNNISLSEKNIDKVLFHYPSDLFSLNLKSSILFKKDLYSQARTYYDRLFYLEPLNINLRSYRVIKRHDLSSDIENIIHQSDRLKIKKFDFSANKLN